MEFSEITDVYRYLFKYERPIILQQLIQNGNRSAIKKLFGKDLNLINFCILVFKLKNVPTLFKLLSNADFGRTEEEFYERVLCNKRRDFSTEVFARMRKALAPRRYQLMLQILLVFSARDMDLSDAKNTLRLIWVSAPDSMIIFSEIENALKNDLSLEEIKDIYNFYIEAVGIGVSKLEPRNLKELCRTMIRSQLCKRDFWLPSVINGMDLPITLKGFLNLDE